tara:strand:- start:1604 stop:1990 length:387 start_codon:yes stop_codon:yes gene_type:complete
MSTLKADTIVASDGTSPATLTKQQASKAYVVSGYSSGTPQETKLFNVSSLTDTSSGRMGVNFTSVFNSVNYTKIGTAGLNEDSTFFCLVHEDSSNSSSASVAQMLFINHNNSADDPIKVHLVFHGDLA